MRSRITEEKEVAGGEKDRLFLCGSLGFFMKKGTVNMYLQDVQGGQGTPSVGKSVAESCSGNDIRASQPPLCFLKNYLRQTLRKSDLTGLGKGQPVGIFHRFLRSLRWAAQGGALLL